MSTPETKKANELVITRIFNAPVKLVWRAWTEPEHFKKWWGPKDFYCTTCKQDLRVGGKYLYNMVGPDKTEYWSGGEFTEIIPLKKIVCTDHFSDAEGNKKTAKEVGMPVEDWPDELYVTITFEDMGDKTKMVLKHVGIPAAEMSEMTNAGWNQSFDKLEANL